MRTRFLITSHLNSSSVSVDRACFSYLRYYLQVDCQSREFSLIIWSRGYVLNDDFLRGYQILEAPFYRILFHAEWDSYYFVKVSSWITEGQRISIIVCVQILLLEIWLLDCAGSRVIMGKPPPTRYLIGVSPAVDVIETIGSSAHEILLIFLSLEYPSATRYSFLDSISLLHLEEVL